MRYIEEYPELEVQFKKIIQRVHDKSEKSVIHKKSSIQCEDVVKDFEKADEDDMMFLDIEMPVDEIVINNEIPVNEPERENVPLEKNDMVDTDREYETAAEMPVDEIVINNEIPVDEPERENVPLEKIDMANTDRKYETAAELFANTKFSGKVIGIDVDLDDVLKDLEQKGLGEKIYSEPAELFANTKFRGKVIGIDVDLDEVLKDLEQKGLGEKIYSGPKKPNIIADEILRGKHVSIISGKKEKSNNQKKRSKDDNGEKQRPVSPLAMHKSGKYGKKIIATDDDNGEEEEEDDVVILSQSSTSSSSSGSSSSSSGSSSSASPSDPPTIMNENNVAEKYDEEHQYRPKAGSSKPKNESVDITDFCVDCEGYQCPNKAATPYRQFCKGCHEKWQMGEQPHIPQPSPMPNPIFEKRQQLVDDRIKCLQDQIRELEESLSHVKCDLCGGEPIVNEFGHCEHCAQLID
ncbi:uncharacterized protein LOC122856344 [Aphidius gifuensis]|uniref:uncharacterized protein LOC122856344 n=1 Tax=Aphidius gifuensis TaxID=684658 RepID=UPI001CDD3D14|nr:uncharacterized protein LOC122856344 [Aphidius gifuensis]